MEPKNLYSNIWDLNKTFGQRKNIMRRPFTKNTGNYIKGTEQVGNLSVGISPSFRQPS